jgi:low molecular weight protein-tyrosine phosphatase
VKPARVLVVCHANVARSVAAAYLLAGSVDERGAAIELATAGTHATTGQPVSARTSTSLAGVLGHEVSLSAHRAHQLTEADLDEADLVVAMEAAQVRAVRRTHATAADRVATLAVLASELPRDARPLAARVAAMSLATRDPDDSGDVADPAGGDDEAYEATMASLVALCSELARRLAG